MKRPIAIAICLGIFLLRRQCTTPSLGVPFTAPMAGLPIAGRWAAQRSVARGQLGRPGPAGRTAYGYRGGAYAGGYHGAYYGGYHAGYYGGAYYHPSYYGAAVATGAVVGAAAASAYAARSYNYYPSPYYYPPPY